MQATATTLDHEQEHVQTRNKVVIASLIGTVSSSTSIFTRHRCGDRVPLIFFPGRSLRQRYNRSPPCIARLARPIGSALFGHFGDRVGAEVTLVASLLTMGISTVIIGLLPGCATIGIFAPLLLALARFRSGTGAGRRMGRRGVVSDGECAAAQAARCMAPSTVGRAVGFFFANGTFLLLSRLLTDERLPELGLARAVYLLGGAGDYRPGNIARVALHETPVFAKVAAAKNR